MELKRLGEFELVYLDNAATSYPKPLSVINSTNYAIKNLSFNSGRGGYKESMNSAKEIYSVREKIANMFGFEPQNVAFTLNCTMALNMAIKGLVKKGSHVIISSLEHNSVYRVVNKLKEDGIITYDVANYNYDDEKTVKNFESLINNKTSLIVCMAASNVFGVTFPIRKIGEMAKKHKIKFVVDAAQGAGVLPLNAKEDNFDVLCAPGHKCLYGMMGTGFIAVKNDLDFNTIIEGGTGSESYNPLQPSSMPERLEAGTLNNSGIYSLGAGIDFVNSRGIDNIYESELFLTSYIYDELLKNPNVTLYCKKPEKYKSVPLISFNYKDYKSEKTARLLASNDIATRAGLHCSVLAHEFFKTSKIGTVRISPSVFTTKNNCKYLINVLKNI